MRKIDYQALSQLVARVRSDADAVLQHSDSRESRLVAQARKQAAGDIAQDFCRTASVDRAAFLKACGIE